jgi:hypothetical protein
MAASQGEVTSHDDFDLDAIANDLSSQKTQAPASPAPKVTDISDDDLPF